MLLVFLTLQVMAMHSQISYLPGYDKHIARMRMQGSFKQSEDTMLSLHSKNATNTISKALESFKRQIQNLDKISDSDTKYEKIILLIRNIMAYPEKELNPWLLQIINGDFIINKGRKVQKLFYKNKIIHELQVLGKDIKKKLDKMKLSQKQDQENNNLNIQKNIERKKETPDLFIKKSTNKELINKFDNILKKIKKSASTEASSNESLKRYHFSKRQKDNAFQKLNDDLKKYDNRVNDIQTLLRRKINALEIARTKGTIDALVPVLNSLNLPKEKSQQREWTLKVLKNKLNGMQEVMRKNQEDAEMRHVAQIQKLLRKQFPQKN